MARKKAPPYDKEKSDILRSAGLSHRKKHPIGTVNAVSAVNEHQRSRIKDVATQERMVKNSERIDTSRTAMVSPLSDALNGLPDAARQGLEGFYAIYMGSMPGGAMDYEPKVAGGGKYIEPEGLTYELAGVEAKLGPKLARVARFSVMLAQGAVIATWQAENAERVGLRLYEILGMEE